MIRKKELVKKDERGICKGEVLKLKMELIRWKED